MSDGALVAVAIVAGAYLLSRKDEERDTRPYEGPVQQREEDPWATIGTATRKFLDGLGWGP